MYRYGNFVFKILLITSLYALCKLRVFLLTQHAHLFLTFQKKKKCKRTSEGRTVEWFDKVKNKQTNQKSSPSSCSGKSRFPHCRACWDPEPSRTPQHLCSPPTCPPHALEEASQCPGTPARVCPWTLRLRRRSATALWGRQAPGAAAELTVASLSDPHDRIPARSTGWESAWAVTSCHRKLKAAPPIYPYLRLGGNCSIRVKNSQPDLSNWKADIHGRSAGIKLKLRLW